MLKLYLFGVPRVELDGAPADINRRKATALLAYLAVTQQPHSREALATLFWPDNDQSRALAYLRTTLWTLNTTLGEHWLDTEHDTVYLTPDAGVWVDVHRFRQQIAVEDESCIDGLSDALTLYSGDFMAGFTLSDSPDFDDWQLFQRESLRQDASQAFDKLVVCCMGQSAFEEAIPYARRWLALDRLHEPAHRALMRLYDSVGQRSTALRQYQECAALLAEELGVDPEPETTELYETIQSRRKPVTTTRRITPALSPPPSAHNLPAPGTSLVGREDELAEIAGLLDDPTCRLLTVVGQGGIGKTSLALQAAHNILTRYRDGVYFVPLAPVNAVEYLIPAVADALRFSAFRDGDPKPQLLAYLSEKRMLLVMDNFEHLIDGAALITEILNSAPGVKVLATSRERLHLREEWLYEIQGLTYPANSDLSSLETYGAVQLFLQNARRVQPDFALTSADKPFVARICRLVEGMPLGVELAAAWLQVLSCEEIAQEIARSLDFLTTSFQNLPPRHRSLRAVFESSWERLPPNEQTVLSILSIFRGGFEREAAQAVAGASLPLLLALVNKSLLQRSPEGRYNIHELLRQFAEEKLNTQPNIRDRAYAAHVDYHAAFLAAREPILKSADQITALDAIETEIDNVRLAWMLAVNTRQVDHLQTMLATLVVFYLIRRRIDECREMFGGTIEYLETLPLNEAETILLAQLKAQQGMICRTLDEREKAFDLYLEAGLVLRKREDLQSPDLAMTYMMLAHLANWPVEAYEKAEYWARRALAVFEAQGDRWGLAWARTTLGDTAHFSIDYATSQQFYRQALVVFRDMGDRWGQGVALGALGEVAYTLGDYAEAEQLYREALALHRAVGEQYSISWTTARVAEQLFRLGRYADANTLARQSVAIARELGDWTSTTHGLVQLAGIAIAQDRYDEALDYLRDSLDLFTKTESLQGPAWARLALSWTLLQQGDPDQARRRAQEALVVLDLEGSPWGQSAAHYYLGEVACFEGDLATAGAHFRLSIQRGATARSVMLLSRHLIGVARWLAQTGAPEQAIELLAFLIDYPPSWQETRDRAQRLLNALARESSPDAVAAARAHGTGRTMDEVVAETLERLPTQLASPPQLMDTSDY